MTRDQLRAAIAASGLSISEFARSVLVRDPRTLRRWLSGERPIPRHVLEKIAKLLDDPEGKSPRALARRESLKAVQGWDKETG